MKEKYEKIIFVTGGAGFIGSNYLNKYVPKYPDYLFINIDALTYAGNLENIIITDCPNYRFHKADVRDAKVMEDFFLSYKPQGVIHFAAESHVDLSITNPHLFVETNVLGTHNLLFLSKKYRAERFHQVSTDEVYGSLKTHDPPFNEKTLLNPNNPYSASKAGADMLVRSYNKTFGLNITITRCSNNYGPNADKTKLIPSFINKLLSSQKVPLYGKGENIRDWLFVEDHIDAIDLVFRNGQSGEIYNVGGNFEITNLEITRNLLSLTNQKENMIDYVADRLGHDYRYAIDASKIKSELGWEPKMKFASGLKKTFDFYKERFLK